MKHFVLAFALACAIPGFSQTLGRAETQEPKSIHTTLPNGTPVTLVANSIEKNWVTSMVYLKGDVRVEIYTPKSSGVTVLHASEVDYDGNTGKFTPRGKVDLSVNDAR